MIEHHLVVYPHAWPVKQKVRKQALEQQEFIIEEIRKFEEAGLVRGVLHPTWLANPVVVRKANGKWRLCIDYTDINKACRKDPFPLPRIDQIVDSTAGCDLLSFLDAYLGYHQIFHDEGRRREDRVHHPMWYVLFCTNAFRVEDHWFDICPSSPDWF